MKKQLLATTALVGASLMVTGDALAQASPVTLGLKGYWREYLVGMSEPSNSQVVLAPGTGTGGTTFVTGCSALAEINGTCNQAGGGIASNRGHLRTFAVGLESRTRFEGEGKLDNGITPGVRIDFESFNRQGVIPSVSSTNNLVSSNSNVSIATQSRRAQGYFKSAWGELRMGNTDNIGRWYSTYIAEIDNFGSDSPSGIYALGTNNTEPDLASGASRIMYLSPKFAGFDFGFSYAPDGSSDFSSSGVPQFDKDGIGFSRQRGANSQVWSPLFRYIGPVGPVAVEADYWYNGSTNECRGRTTAGVTGFAAGCVGSDANVTSHASHGSVSYMGWKLGMGYMKYNNRNGNGLDQRVFAPGLDYSTGPWKFGFYYSTGDYDFTRSQQTGLGVFNTAPTTVAGTAAKSTDTMDFYALDAEYKLGPGINLQAQIAYQRYKYGPNANFRNASDFGFSNISSQNSVNFAFGAFFSY